jgi:hypothetical protein
VPQLAVSLGSVHPERSRAVAAEENQTDPLNGGFC